VIADTADRAGRVHVNPSFGVGARSALPDGVFSQATLVAKERWEQVNRQVAKIQPDEPDEDLDRLTREAIGAALDLHRIRGPGLLESVDEEARCVELSLRQIRSYRQVALSVDYKYQRIGTARWDLLVRQRLIVELKAIESIVPVHLARVPSYLKLGGLRLGLVINFNVPKLRSGIQRCINSSCVSAQLAAWRFAPNPRPFHRPSLSKRQDEHCTLTCRPRRERCARSSRRLRDSAFRAQLADPLLRMAPFVAVA
jgi:GxxExxY protein